MFSFQGQRFLATVEGRQDNFFILNWSDDPKSLFEQYGQIPLPPYMNRAAEKLDEERYETIYADPDQKASVAAPTAGMHFDQELLNSLQKKGVEFGYVHLHVGAGTFQPVKTDHIEDHVIHKELVEVDASLIDQVKRVKASNGKILQLEQHLLGLLKQLFKMSHQPLKVKLLCLFILDISLKLSII